MAEVRNWDESPSSVFPLRLRLTAATRAATETSSVQDTRRRTRGQRGPCTGGVDFFSLRSSLPSHSTLDRLYLFAWYLSNLSAGSVSVFLSISMSIYSSVWLSIVMPVLSSLSTFLCPFCLSLPPPVSLLHFNSSLASVLSPWRPFTAGEWLTVTVGLDGL